MVNPLLLLELWKLLSCHGYQSPTVGISTLPSVKCLSELIITGIGSQHLYLQNLKIYYRFCSIAFILGIWCLVLIRAIFIIFHIFWKVIPTISVSVISKNFSLFSWAFHSVSFPLLNFYIIIAQTQYKCDIWA